LVDLSQEKTGSLTGLGCLRRHLETRLAPVQVAAPEVQPSQAEMSTGLVWILVEQPQELLLGLHKSVLRQEQLCQTQPWTIRPRAA
jgi:hypothetical protein